MTGHVVKRSDNRLDAAIVLAHVLLANPCAIRHQSLFFKRMNNRIRRSGAERLTSLDIRLYTSKSKILKNFYTCVELLLFKLFNVQSRVANIFIPLIHEIIVDVAQ